MKPLVGLVLFAFSLNAAHAAGECRTENSEPTVCTDPKGWGFVAKVLTPETKTPSAQGWVRLNLITEVECPKEEPRRPRRVSP